MRSTLAILCVGLGCVLTPALAISEEYRNSADHFSFTVPNGWTHMRGAGVSEANARAKQANLPNIVFVAGFEPLGAAPGSEPRVLVQVLRCSVPFFAVNDTAVELKKQGLKQAQIDTSRRGFMSQMEPGTFCIDESRNRIHFCQVFLNDGGRYANGYTTIHFGSDAVVYIHGYAARSGPASIVPTLDAINASLAFDFGYRYGGRNLGSSLAGCLVGGLGAAIFVCFRRNLATGQLAWPRKSEAVEFDA